MIKQLKYFLDNRLEVEPISELDNNVIITCRRKIKDDDYFKFISSVGNGGFFFDHSLHFYRLNNEEGFKSILSVNEELVREFGFLFDGLYSFAQDIFANQFAFNIDNGEVSFFNIETGQREVLAKGFKSWLDFMMSDIEYYTGMTYEREWKERHQIADNQRLQPKIPFVIGGNYKIDNFYVNDYPAYLSYNADIAKQIFTIKDGEKVKLNIKRFE